MTEKLCLVFVKQFDLLCSKSHVSRCSQEEINVGHLNARDPKVGSIVNTMITFWRTLSRAKVSNSWFVDYRQSFTSFSVVYLNPDLPTRPSEVISEKAAPPIVLWWAVRIVVLTLSCLVHVPTLNSINEAKLKEIKKIAFINYRNSLLYIQYWRSFRSLNNPFSFFPPHLLLNLTELQKQYWWS